MTFLSSNFYLILFSFILFIMVRLLILFIFTFQVFTLNFDEKLSGFARFSEDVDLSVDGKITRDLCFVCKFLAPIVRLTLKISRNSNEQIALTIKRICDQNLTNNFTPEICRSFIDLYSNSIIDMLKKSHVSSFDLCNSILSCSSNVIDKNLEWKIIIPAKKNTQIGLNKTNHNLSQKHIRILHLTDIHIDFEYRPGSISNCNEPICCRNQSKQSNLEEKSFAGYWGEYTKCDLPYWTVENMLKHISSRENFDFIYWTGDILAHDIWKQNREAQLKALNHIEALFVKYFPNKIIYSSTGNHDSIPCNLFEVGKMSKTKELYSKLASQWISFGLPKSTKNNIEKGAFFTTLIKPNLRLISLNTNYCYNLNFWIYENAVDPLGQLDWLVQVLLKSEDNYEKVHIIGHACPSTCLSSWSKAYYEIINRFSDTITGQFFGHSHHDFFKIYYDLNNQYRPINVAFVTPSVSSYTLINPGYRIYSGI
jgi:sphingomyelin phosphodiesterase